jgi:hypothetical protein
MSWTCLVPAGLTGQLYAAGGTGKKDPAAGFAHQVAVRTLRQSEQSYKNCANQEQDYKAAPIRNKMTKLL